MKPEITNYLGNVTPIQTVNFPEGSLTDKELEHVRIASRANFHQVGRCALIMKEDNVTYTEAVKLYFNNR